MQGQGRHFWQKEQENTTKVQCGWNSGFKRESWRRRGRCKVKALHSSRGHYSLYSLELCTKTAHAKESLALIQQTNNPPRQTFLDCEVCSEKLSELNKTMSFGMREFHGQAVRNAQHKQVPEIQICRKACFKTCSNSVTSD